MPRTVSVVIPAHNAEATIAQAIDSVRGQTVEVGETIVAGDGCTDRTLEIARASGAKALDLDKANGSVARNAGAREADGDLLFFLDADDWWEETKVEVHTSAWDGFDGSFVIDRSMPWNPDGSRSYWTGGLERDGAAGWEEFLVHHAWASGSSFSVSKDCYWRVGGFNEGLNKFQDVDFWVRSAHACGEARALSVPLTNYRLTSGSSVSRTTSFIDENLGVLFDGWPFASHEQTDRFRSHAFLTAAEVTPWPASVEYFKKAHWPFGRRFFWKCLYQSLRLPRSA